MKEGTGRLDSNTSKISGILKLQPVMIVVLCILLMIKSGILEVQAQRLSRDLNVDLLINQVGYVPHAGKTCVTEAT